jgi:hypothetical protein
VRLDWRGRGVAGGDLANICLLFAVQALWNVPRRCVKADAVTQKGSAGGLEQRAQAPVYGPISDPFRGAAVARGAPTSGFNDNTTNLKRLRR